MTVLARFVPLLLLALEASLVLALFVAISLRNERRAQRDPVFFAHWTTVLVVAVAAGAVSAARSLISGAAVGAGLVRDTAVLALGLCLFVGAAAVAFGALAGQTRRFRIASSFGAGFAVLPVALWVMVMASCMSGGECL